MAIAMGLAEAKNSFSLVTAGVNGVGRTATVLKNGKPWAVTNSAATTSVD